MSRADSRPHPERIAFVHDALPCYGGAERVLERVLGLLPGAPVHTLVHRPEVFGGTGLEGQDIRTSFIDRLPGAHRNHRPYLPLMPMAIERFDLSGFEMIVSMHYAVAHGVLVRPSQCHVSYTYTPLRQAWQAREAFLRTLSTPARWLARPVLHYLRSWDRRVSSRVDRFVAISGWISKCIRQLLQRRTHVEDR